MVEQRFQELRKTLKPKEFNSIDFLKRKSAEIKGKDPKLSNRILMRVRNLEKQKINTGLNENPAVVKIDQIQNKQEQGVSDKKTQPTKSKFIGFVYSPFFLCVVVPTLLFAFYQIVLATDRFESRAQVIVQKPDSSSTLDSSLALLTGFGAVILITPVSVFFITYS